MTQAELLRYLAEVMQDVGLPYMIGGSHAAMYYGEPRLTRDVDIVVSLRSIGSAPARAETGSADADRDADVERRGDRLAVLDRGEESPAAERVEYRAVQLGVRRWLGQLHLGAAVRSYLESRDRGDLDAPAAEGLGDLGQRLVDGAGPGMAAAEAACGRGAARLI